MKKKWSLKFKIISLLTSAALSLFGVCWLSVVTIQSSVESAQFLGEKRIPLTEKLGDLRASNQAIPRWMWLAMNFQAGSSEREKFLKNAEEVLDNLDKSIVGIKSFELVSESKITLDRIEMTAKELRNLVEKVIVDARKNIPENDEAIKKTLVNEMPPHALKLTELAIGLSEIIKTQNQKTVSLVLENSKKSMMSMITIACVVIITFLTIGFIFTTQLSKTFKIIAETLAMSAQELTSASNVVSSASVNLSQATAEQAASLEETAASIEEMNAMISKNSDNALETSKLSELSREKSQQGVLVVNEMIISMEEITNSNNQISAIVDMIKDIGNKTKIINDIVFQTKLLSFNASVEAARAGEHGKGFAVVAEEVGNLAQMSGTASKEISSLLEESVQKVESLISQTKQRVETGSVIVRKCGDVFGEISKNIVTVASMSAEISNASKEQSQGISEITKAVSQLDQVTQQNASTTEETSNEAEGLAVQARNINVLATRLLVNVMGGVEDASRLESETPKALTSHKEDVSNVVVKLEPKRKAHTLHLKATGTDPGVISSIPERGHQGFREI